MIEKDAKYLQAIGDDFDKLNNPIYCLTVNETFLFTISNNDHYPQYFKDSTLNTNKDFDYGAFLDLRDQM